MTERATNSHTMLINHSFSRFKACFRVMEPVRLPPFTGSAFRGALGHALRRVTYGTKEGCADCPARSECRYGDLYAYLFESPWDHPFIEPAHQGLRPRLRRETYPQPLVLDPPAGGGYDTGSLLGLPFTLVGRAIRCFPFLACALSIMGAQGVGRGRGRILLEAVVNGLPSDDGGETVVYDAKTGRIVGPGEVLDFGIIRRWAMDSLPTETGVREVRIRFLTPFRYKYEGKLGQPLTFEIFMRNLFRRLVLLSVHSPLSFEMDYKDLLSAAACVQTARSALRWYRWERYSNKKRKRL